jgi:XTP/dITP diphosphohydrolase
MKLVVATRNRHKLRELTELLAGVAVEVISIESLRPGWDVDEIGDTFEANATLKAEAAARATGEWALGDDSGLEIDALAGAPGVRSARFAGVTGAGADAANNAKMAAAMVDVVDSARGARFRCVLALVSPTGRVELARGTCEGRITRAPRGTGGFGYDPYFEVEGADGHTMAELSAGEKNQCSHRARALAALREILLAVTEAGAQSSRHRPA